MNVTLPVARVCALLRLIGEVREIVKSGDNANRHAVAGLSTLVEADAGGIVFGPRNTGVGTNFLSLVPFGFSAPEARQAERLYVMQHGNALDPAAAKTTLALTPRAVTVRRRRDLVQDEAWYHSDFVNVYRRPWRLDDSIYGAFGASDGRLVGFACFRAWGARPFTHQDIALAQLFWEECVAQIAERDEAPLSRRQRETLRLLLKGDSAKAIASKLALSVHTVNEYIKTLYRVKGVRSRAELMARSI